MINAAEQDPVALQRYYEMDVIPSSVPGSATTCPDSCINSIMIDGNITYQVPCSPALPNKP